MSSKCAGGTRPCEGRGPGSTPGGDIAQLSALSSQLSALSSQLSALSSQLSALSSQLSALSSQLSALSSQLSALSSQLSALSSQLSALSSQLSALSSQLSALSSQLSALSSQLSALSSQLSALSSQLSALQGTQHSALFSTLEPDGQATGCNPVDVGSTPTGVFFKQADWSRRARGASPSPFGGWFGRVPHRGSKPWRDRIVVAQLDRAPDAYSGSHGFESRPQHPRSAKDRLPEPVLRGSSTLSWPEGGGRPDRSALRASALAPRLGGSASPDATRHADSAASLHREMVRARSLRATRRGPSPGGRTRLKRGPAPRGATAGSSRSPKASFSLHSSNPDPSMPKF